MPDMKKILDCSKAPLTQWEPAIGGTISEGKKLEDSLIYPKIIKELIRQNAQSITGVIADEGRLELKIASEVPGAKTVCHLTLTGAFETAARKNVADAKAGAKKVHVVADTAAIKPHSQDAVVLNMILGSVATPDDHQNIGRLVQLAASFLKKDGQLLIVRPNPKGGEFSTYKCLTPANDLTAGKNYDFAVKGLENLGTMNDLYTPDSFLKEFLDAAGLKMGKTQGIYEANPDSSVSKPFLFNVCKVKKAAPVCHH